MDQKLYFTRAGADRLLAKKRALIAQLAAVQMRKGATVEQGETWHDNAEFENLVREEIKLNGQIGDVNAVIDRMIVVDSFSQNTDRLRLGQVAELFYNGKSHRIFVGGHEDSDLTSDPPVMSYLAPLIRPFMGKEAGFSTGIVIRGKLTEVSLESIGLLEDKEAT